jgi:hypothetical protein
VTSYWGGGGGYLDFGVQDTSNSRWVLYYWIAGTCLTGMVLLLSMFYITVEVSTLSHLLGIVRLTIAVVPTILPLH